MWFCQRRFKPPNDVYDPESPERPLQDDVAKQPLFLAPVSRGVPDADLPAPGFMQPPGSIQASPFGGALAQAAPPPPTGYTQPPSISSPFAGVHAQAPLPQQPPIAPPSLIQSSPFGTPGLLTQESQGSAPGQPFPVAAAGTHTSGSPLASSYNPGGPCSVERLQAAFDPLVDKAMALHDEAAGKEGIQKGLRALYRLLAAGQLDGSVQETLVRLVTAVETRNIGEANKVREEIVRTTTTGWVEGGTWQWVLKHLITAAKNEAPLQAAESGYVAPTQDLSADSTHIIKTFGAAFSEARESLDAKKTDEISKKLEVLYTALGNGFVNATSCQQLVAAALAVEEKDVKAAQQRLQEIAKTDFQNSKAWLPALKQLLKLCEACWDGPSMY